MPSKAEVTNVVYLLDAVQSSLKFQNYLQSDQIVFRFKSSLFACHYYQFALYGHLLFQFTFPFQKGFGIAAFFFILTNLVRRIKFFGPQVILRKAAHWELNSSLLRNW